MKTGTIALLMLLWVAKTASAQPEPVIYCNPLTINGHPLNYDTFSLNSRGVLAVVEAASQRHKPVSFRVYLRRAGAIVRQGASNETRDVYSAQLDELLPFARFGDELVIEPTQATNQQIRRVIKLKSFNWLVLNDNC